MSEQREQQADRQKREATREQKTDRELKEARKRVRELERGRGR